MRLFLCLFLLSLSSFAQSSLMLETGAAWQNRNDVRIDPAKGDTLEFDEFQDSPSSTTA